MDASNLVYVCICVAGAMSNRVRVAAGSTVAANGDELNTLKAGGVGAVEGRIAIVQANIAASTAAPNEECVMDVEVWVEVRAEDV